MNRSNHNTDTKHVRSRPMRPLLSALLLVATDSGCSAERRSCPVDERANISSGLTFADVCAENGYTVIVRFQTPQTVDQVLPLLDPLRAALACEDPARLMGQPGKTCYIVRLGPGFCCSDASAYFADQVSPKASTDVPHPETPCSCETHWTTQ